MVKSYLISKIFMLLVISKLIFHILNKQTLLILKHLEILIKELQLLAK